MTGRLIDADGKPAKGGVVFSVKRWNAADFGSQRVSEAKLDADGRFRCDDLPPGPGYEITAADRLIYGYSSKMEPQAFKEFPMAKDRALEAGKALDLGTFNVATGKRVEGPAAQAAPADVPILGRIVDLEGRPVRGVRVKVEGYHCPKSGNLDEWLAGVKTGSPQWITASVIDWQKHIPDNATKEAVTDADGRFRLTGIGAERNVDLELRGDLIALNRIEVVTRKMPPMAAPGFGNQYGPGSQTVYGAEFTYTAAPCRPIKGIVNDAEDRRAAAGRRDPQHLVCARSSWVGTMALRVKTDAQGKFRLLGMPKGKNRLLAVPNDEQPYFLHRIDVPDPPGAGPVQVEVGITRGLWIEGKLTEEGDRQARGRGPALLCTLPGQHVRPGCARVRQGPERRRDGVPGPLPVEAGRVVPPCRPARPASSGALAVNKEYMSGAGYESIKGAGRERPLGDVLESRSLGAEQSDGDEGDQSAERRQRGLRGFARPIRR